MYPEIDMIPSVVTVDYPSSLRGARLWVSPNAPHTNESLVILEVALANVLT